MRYIKGLTQENMSILEKIYKQSKYYQVRQRAHCIKLSYSGYSIAELIKIFQVSRNTIYNWFDNWEESSLVGLYNHPGRGRKKTFNVEQEILIKEWVLATPKNLSQVQEKIGREWGIKTNKDTIKRRIKALKMGWYRIKRRVADNPLPEFYEQKIQELEKLFKQERNGEIEIRYVDESGFSLTPYIQRCLAREN
jgi:transposase